MRYRDFDDMLKNKAESLPDHAALRYGEKTVLPERPVSAFLQTAAQTA